MKRKLIMGLRGSTDALRQGLPAVLRHAEFRPPQWAAGSPTVELVADAYTASATDEIMAWGKEIVGGLTRAARIEIVLMPDVSEYEAMRYVVLDMHRMVEEHRRYSEFTGTLDCTVCGRIKWNQTGPVQVKGDIPGVLAIASCNILVMRADCIPVAEKHGVAVRPLANRSDYVQCVASGVFAYTSDNVHQCSQDACHRCGRFGTFSLTDHAEGELPMTTESKAAVFERGWTRCAKIAAVEGSPLLVAEDMVGWVPPLESSERASKKPHYPVDQLYSHYAISGQMWAALERVAGPGTIPIAPLSDQK